MNLKFEPWNSIGKEEEEAALRVIRSGVLSGFLGGEMEGGPEVRALEYEWAEPGQIAVSVNSATSGLLIALKAVGVTTGQRVICSPYSMSAGVAAIRWLGAAPVFADIDDSYCLSSDTVERVFAHQSAKAILTTNLFGNVSKVQNNYIPVIEDNAQAVFSHYGFGDIVVESTNVHKPLNSGEGGICVTESDDLAYELKRLRNHGEMDGGPPGLNLRMTEVTAAIARAQLKKGRDIVEGRQYFVKRFLEGISKLPTIRPPKFEENNTYYALPIRMDAQDRDEVVEELNKRGIPFKAGYTKPLYNLPAFSRFGTKCPHCELIESELMLFECYRWKLNNEIIDEMIEIFREVLQ